MEVLIDSIWFLSVTLGWVLITHPILKAYAYANLYSTFKVLASIFIWILSNLVVAVITLSFIL
jgi:hypothetical protein